MEEKVLIKGVFGGKIITIILYIIAAIGFALLTVIDLVAEFSGILIMTGVISAIFLVAYGIIVSIIMKKRELIVTNKRVIARGVFSFRTDFPIEKITDVSMRWFGGIGCGTPSLKIMLYFCKNKQEIFDTVASETLKRDSAFLG